MKQYHDSDIWIDVQVNGTINIGFRKEFIEQKLLECFHVIPGDIKRINKDDPMLVIETNCELESIKAPMEGFVHYFNPKARDFPDRLKEEDVILTLGPRGINKTKSSLETFALNWNDEMFNNFVINAAAVPRRE